MSPQPHTKFLHNLSSRSRDMGDGCARAHVQICPTHDLCKTQCYWVPYHTASFSTNPPAVLEIWERGVHVRTCRCAPLMICVKRNANGSRTTLQVSAQSVQPFSRYGRGVCTCARAHVQTYPAHDLCKTQC